MELSMQMLAEKLKPYNPKLHISWDDRPSITNVKFIFQDKNAHRSEFVYIAQAGDIQEQMPPDNRVNIICIGNNALVDKLCKEASGSFIVLDAIHDPFDVFDIIQSYFAFCNHWERELLDSVMKGNGLQELIDLSDRIFNNPMYVLDSAFMALAWSKDIRADSTNDVWRSIAGERHVSTRLMKSNKDSELLSYLNSQIEPIFVPKPHRAILYNIRVGSKTVARVTVEEARTSLSESHFQFIKILSKSILAIIQRDLSFQKTQGSLYECFIIEQLEGKMHDDRIIREYLRYQGWKHSDSFRVVLVQGGALDNGTLEYYGNLLKGIFHGSRFYLYEKNLVFIINEDKTGHSNHRSHSSLAEFLAGNSLKGGISSSFTNFSSLHEYYLQASTALRLGSCIKKNQSLFEYKDYAVYHIIENCSKSMSLNLICHPAVMTLYTYDKEFHTDYFYSLYIYLIESKKLSDSAAVLGIHRNTAAYRINKILSITDLDLRDENETPYILFSYKVIEYINVFLTEDHQQHKAGEGG